MSALLLTEGLGNGTFSGSVSKVLLEGLTPGEPELGIILSYFQILGDPDMSVPVLFKNVAGQYVYAQALNADGPVDDNVANLSLLWSVDGGDTFNPTDATLWESLGEGLFRLPLSQAETNGDVMVGVGSSTTPGVFFFVVPNPQSTRLPEDSDPFTQAGELKPITIGDDYVLANGSAFVFDFEPPTGLTVAGTCWFGGVAQVGNPAQAWSVEGTLTDLGNGNFRATFEAPDIAEGRSPGIYDWSVKVKDANNNERRVRYGCVQLVRDVSGVTI